MSGRPKPGIISDVPKQCNPYESWRHGRGLDLLFSHNLSGILSLRQPTMIFDHRDSRVFISPDSRSQGFCLADQSPSIYTASDVERIYKVICIWNLTCKNDFKILPKYVFKYSGLWLGIVLRTSRFRREFQLRWKKPVELLIQCYSQTCASENGGMEGRIIITIILRMLWSFQHIIITGVEESGIALKRKRRKVRNSLI